MAMSKFRLNEFSSLLGPPWPRSSQLSIGLVIACLISVSITLAEETTSHTADTSTAQGTRNTPTKVKRLLLIGGPYDYHPKGSHEYMAGMRIIAKLLENVDGLNTRITNSGKAWPEGPGMIAAADGIVLFREQGARWMQQDPARAEAMEDLGKRGGGCVALHFGMGTTDGQYVDRFRALFGGCFGGSDRLHTEQNYHANLIVADPQHPICRDIRNFAATDEFYYQIKFVQPPVRVTPLIQAAISAPPANRAGNDANMETIAWAWQRDDGGRSFGFTGLHVHNNWRLPEYRRLVAQAILWTLKMAIPEGGINVDVPDEVFALD